MIFGSILMGASRSSIKAIILSKVTLNTILDASIDSPANSNWITTATICKRLSTAHHVRKWHPSNPSSIITAYQSVNYSTKLSTKPWLHAKWVLISMKSVHFNVSETQNLELQWASGWDSSNTSIVVQCIMFRTTLELVLIVFLLGHLVYQALNLSWRICFFNSCSPYTPCWWQGVLSPSQVCDLVVLKLTWLYSCQCFRLQAGLLIQIHILSLQLNQFPWVRCKGVCLAHRKLILSNFFQALNQVWHR